MARRRLALVLICAFFFPALAVIRITGWSIDAAVPHERYYQAVFVLQHLGGPAAREREDIPRRVTRADATESLLHHPDKIFVLGRVADSLAEARGDMPKAALFEAYARLALGDRRTAARLLADYVVESNYDAGHYALLSGILDELGDYPSLLMICSEWHGRDPTCREDRIRFTWAALHNLERYAEAARHMLVKGACLGWQARVYAAKSVLASGEEREAALAIDAALKEYAKDADRIQRLWNHIKDKNRV